jgi:His/Glu/Gln/Arg/opine family amino acid ABC transporter permease subunit
MYSLGLTLASMSIAICIGIVVSMGRLADNIVLRWTSTAFVDFTRGMPFLVLLIWVYYGLAILLDISLTPLVAGIGCLSIKYAGRLAEIFRSGIQAIEKGQAEAALSLGFSKLQTYRRIILPQIVPIVIPPLVNEVVGMIQDSAIVSIVGIWELMRRGNSVANATLKPFEIYSTIAVIYLIMTISLSQLNERYIEKKMFGKKR